MAPRLLILLDVLRFRLRSEIHISGNEAALGRELGPLSQSEHNVDVWGEVLAVDCFVSGVYFQEQAEAVVAEATQLGFTGIGIYPDWKNNTGERQVGFHLGVRPTKRMGDPATWGFKNDEFVSLMAALRAIPMGGGV